MPRQPRLHSKTGIYHVMIRGINKERIFIKGIYKSKFLEIIKEIGEDLVFYVIAYCIMDNHLHLLIKAEENELTTLMKKLNIKYAMYYNRVEERYGHVFQDRFKSEAVEDEKYLLGALRYIHNNPVKARITDNITNYKWSSASDYIKQDSEIISKLYLNEIYKIFSSESEYIKFHHIDDINIYIDTKEEETKNMKLIVNSVIEDFIIEYQIIDQSKVKREQKEELAKRLLKLNMCNIKEIAGYCNFSITNVCELNKKLNKNYDFK